MSVKFVLLHIYLNQHLHSIMMASVYNKPVKQKRGKEEVFLLVAEFVIHRGSVISPGELTLESCGKLLYSVLLSEVNLSPFSL